MSKPYRHGEDQRELYGEGAQRLSSLLRRATVDSYGADDVITTNVSQDEVGEVAQEDHALFTSAGLVARGASDRISEAVLASLGGQSDNAVVVGVLDHGKFHVLDSEGIGGNDADYAILYNMQVRVKVVDGEVQCATLGNAGQSLAFKADADNLNARITALETALNAFVTIFNEHIHPITGTPPVTSMTATPGIPAATAATVTGTAVLKAE